MKKTIIKKLMILGVILNFSSTAAANSTGQKESFWDTINIVKKIEKFVKGKNQQNESTLLDAEKGVFKKGQRNVAADPAARKIQEKIEKAQADKLKKYDQIGE